MFSIVPPLDMGTPNNRKQDHRQTSELCALALITLYNLKFNWVYYGTILWKRQFIK